jgi:hypothetical protein
MKSQLGEAWSARLWAFHTKDHDPIPRALDFVITVSNFRLRVVNLQPLEESFGVSSLLLL